MAAMTSNVARSGAGRCGRTAGQSNTCLVAHEAKGPSPASLLRDGEGSKPADPINPHLAALIAINPHLAALIAINPHLAALIACCCAPLPQVCGDGEGLAGDCVVPLSSAMLPGARQVG
jgi:hypothetical protein